MFVATEEQQNNIVLGVDDNDDIRIAAKEEALRLEAEEKYVFESRVQEILDSAAVIAALKRIDGLERTTSKVSFTNGSVYNLCPPSDVLKK